MCARVPEGEDKCIISVWPPHIIELQVKDSVNVASVRSNICFDKCRRQLSMELIDRRAPRTSRTSILRVSWPYVRRDSGDWEYMWGGSVPGARDLTPQDVYGFEQREQDGQLVVVIPAATWESDGALGWCGAYWDPRRKCEEILVPLPAWFRRVETVGMDAPELSARRLLDTRQVAHMVGCSAPTISVYLSRGLMPLPVVRIGHSPAWARPQIQHWLEIRPGVRGRPAR